MSPRHGHVLQAEGGGGAAAEGPAGLRTKIEGAGGNEKKVEHGVQELLTFASSVFACRVRSSRRGFPRGRRDFNTAEEEEGGRDSLVDEDDMMDALTAAAS